MQKIEDRPETEGWTTIVDGKEVWVEMTQYTPGRWTIEAVTPAGCPRIPEREGGYTFDSVSAALEAAKALVPMQ